MYLRLTIIILFFSLTTFCYGQNVDSLILAAEQLKGNQKASAYEEIGLEYYKQDFTIKAKEYFYKALELSEENKDTLGQMNALKNLLRVAYHKEDSVELSLVFAGYLEVLSVDSDNKMMQAYVQHHKGRADREDFELSINRMKQALQIYEDAEKKESANIVNRELGEALLDTAPTEAFRYFQRSLELSEELNLEEDIYLARSNISSALISMKQYEDARNFCERNIEIAKNANNQDFLAYNYLLIGISYQQQDKLDKAIEYALQGKEICEENDLMDKKQYTYQLLKEIYNEKGNISKAFDYFAKEKQIEAALEKEKTANKLAAINAQFELEKKEQEHATFKEIKYYENLAKNGLLIFLGVLALFLYQLSVRRRLKVQLQKEELEKLKVEQMLETEERERLKERLEYKERELASNTMFMLQKNKMLTDLKEKIGTIKVSNDEQLRKQVNNIDRNIEMNMNFDDDWQKFKLHFAEVHPNFFEKLYQENNALNNNDTRFCAYIRMGLTTKEIAQLMGISAGSVQKARYRLKKKLDLGKEVNLIEYITNL